MTAKEYLDGVRKAGLKAEELLREKEVISDGQGAGRNARLEEIGKELQYLEGLRVAAGRLIESLEPQNRDILRMRYVLYMSWNDVERCLAVDRRWMFRRHKKAIRELEKKQKEFPDILFLVPGIF